MKNEKTFMMIFRYTPNFDKRPTEQEQAEMRQSWGSFIGNLALKEKLVHTHQLGFEGKQIAADLSVTEGVAIAEGQVMGGNMVVKANSINEAIEMAKDCPILKMGGTVEVRSIMPMER